MTLITRPVTTLRILLTVFTKTNHSNKRHTMKNNYTIKKKEKRRNTRKKRKM